MSQGTIKKVAGPLVVAGGMRDANMFDVVRVSDQRLIGEIIEIHGDEASIQVYEETSGLGPGAPVESTGEPMSVELGPGLISSIYDGIQRPLTAIMEMTGNNLKRGVEVPSLKRDVKWSFTPLKQVGDEVEGCGRTRPDFDRFEPACAGFECGALRCYGGTGKLCLHARVGECGCEKGGSAHCSHQFG